MRRELLVGALALSAAAASADHIEVEFCNITKGITFTPVLVAAHTSEVRMFEVGAPASAALQELAEGGETGALEGAVASAGGATAVGTGLIAPGDCETIEIADRGAATHLSLASMLLPTNDAFTGLDSWAIPVTQTHSIGTSCTPAEGDPITQSGVLTVVHTTDGVTISPEGATINAADCPDNQTTITVESTDSVVFGTYTADLGAYDAGTEENDEIINGAGAPGEPGIPAAPGGDGGTGGTGVGGTAEPNIVRPHPGNIGDTDPTGGASDVDSRNHRWLDPVASVTVRVNQD